MTVWLEQISIILNFSDELKVKVEGENADEESSEKISLATAEIIWQ